jgi:hypothetical protein
MTAKSACIHVTLTPLWCEMSRLSDITLGLLGPRAFLFFPGAALRVASATLRMPSLGAVFGGGTLPTDCWCICGYCVGCSGSCRHGGGCFPIGWRIGGNSRLSLGDGGRITPDKPRLSRLGRNEGLAMLTSVGEASVCSTKRRDESAQSNAEFAEIEYTRRTVLTSCCICCLPIAKRVSLTHRVR